MGRELARANQIKQVERLSSCKMQKLQDTHSGKDCCLNHFESWIKYLKVFLFWCFERGDHLEASAVPNPSQAMIRNKFIKISKFNSGKFGISWNKSNKIANKLYAFLPIPRCLIYHMSPQHVGLYDCANWVPSGLHSNCSWGLPALLCLSLILKFWRWDYSARHVWSWHGFPRRVELFLLSLWHSMFSGVSIVTGSIKIDFLFLWIRSVLWYFTFWRHWEGSTVEQWLALLPLSKKVLDWCWVKI